MPLLLTVATFEVEDRKLAKGSLVVVREQRSGDSKTCFHTSKKQKL